MRYDITLKNYRCFPVDRPARFSITTGGTAAFVGPNNAGKSMPLRFLWEFRPMLQQAAVAGTLWNAVAHQAQGTPVQGSRDPREVFHNRNDLPMEFELSISDFDRAGLRAQAPERLVLRVDRENVSWQADLYVGTDRLVPGGGGRQVDGNVLMLDNRPFADVGPLLLACQWLSSSIYLGSARNAINVSGGEQYFDMQVGRAFVAKWRDFKSGHSKAANEAAIDVREEIRRLFEFAELEINPSADDTTLQVNIDRKSYTLPELGAGVAQVITTLAFAATARPALVLIDEPELSLHPALQIQFLDALRSFASEAVLFSTHSIGLARAGADEIYAVRRDAGASNLSPFESEPSLPELMGEMSFSLQTDLGFERLLLVEGRTDAEPIRVILRKLGVDHKVLVMGVGGGSLINEHSAAELNELKRLADRGGSVAISALIDSEISAPEQPLAADRAGFVQACEAAGIPCHVLQRRALENYFPQSAIRSVMRTQKYSALQPFESLDEAPLGWDKNANWRIAAKMSLDDLNGTDLGEFLCQLVPAR